MVGDVAEIRAPTPEIRADWAARARLAGAMEESLESKSDPVPALLRRSRRYVPSRPIIYPIFSRSFGKCAQMIGYSEMVGQQRLFTQKPRQKRKQRRMLMGSAHHQMIDSHFIAVSCAWPFPPLSCIR
jgi:hypothetical protein